jgi:hypothetical protein
VVGSIEAEDAAGSTLACSPDTRTFFSASAMVPVVGSSRGDIGREWVVRKS